MEVSGNSEKILGLADSQRTYKGAMEDVLNQVDAAVIRSLTEWHGSGSDTFNERYEEFVGFKEGVSGAFDHLIKKTENSSEHWAMTGTNVQNRFLV